MFSSYLSRVAATVVFCALAVALAAQQPPPAPPPPPAADARAATPDAPAAPETTTTPTTAAEPTQPALSPDAEPPLRNIGEPAQPAGPRRARAVRRGGGSTDVPFGDHVVGAGNRVHEVVSIFGSSVVDGDVGGDAVSVFGETTINRDATVGGSAVAVVGRLLVEGSVKQEAVSVLGGVRINGHVGSEAVAVLGNMDLGPNAVVDGDVVVVGGVLTKHPDAIVRGNEVRVPLLGGLINVDWLSTWVRRCLALGRPLAFGDNLWWAWAIALSFLGFYLLLGLIFPRGVDKCVATLETRPGTTVLASLLTVLLTPVALVLLAVTVIGALVIPFVLAGLILATLFGKAVMLAWIGRRIIGPLDGRAQRVAIAILIGGAIVLLLYVVPVFGFLLFKILSWLGLGVVVYTLLLAIKRERPPAPAAAAPGPAPVPVAPTPPPTTEPSPVMSSESSAARSEPSASTMAAAASIGGAVSAGFGRAEETPAAGDASAAGGAPASSMPAASTPPPSGPAAVPPPPPPAPPPTPIPAYAAATTLPRASLWLRLGALFLDVVLVALITGFVNGALPRMLRFDFDPPSLLPVLAIYGAVMWKLKGTTIGGIICGLKVVRTDGRSLDWATTIVRALGCFLSLFVAGLGFIWIAIDDERQSWHDKIAGTAVVRVPKGVPLV